MPDYLALPDEVVAETILWRLPVKSIMQCRCVCKSWYSLITSPNFISTHFLRKALTLNPQFFAGQYDVTDKTGNYLLHFENEGYFRSMLLHVPLPDPNCFIYAVGSVKGLICLCICCGKDGIVNFILYNPSIRHFLSIPPPLSGIGWGVRGFGFDETSRDYKILLIASGSTDGFIYSLSSNCWRVITCPVLYSFRMNFGSVVFVNGRFHWFAYEKNSFNRIPWIMVFDLKDETFGQTSLPECMAYSQVDALDIKEIGQSSIAIIQRNGYGLESHIWVMKEKGSMESWMKLATISEFVLGFRSEDEVMTRYERHCVVSRKINNNGSDQLEEIEKMMDLDKRLLFPSIVHKCVPSLVLLGKRNDVDVIVDVDVHVDVALLEKKAEIALQEV